MMSVNTQLEKLTVRGPGANVKLYFPQNVNQ